jgi:hypothetical protein
MQKVQQVGEEDCTTSAADDKRNCSDPFLSQIADSQRSDRAFLFHSESSQNNDRDHSQPCNCADKVFA